HAAAGQRRFSRPPPLPGTRHIRPRGTAVGVFGVLYATFHVIPFSSCDFQLTEWESPFRATPDGLCGHQPGKGLGPPAEPVSDSMNSTTFRERFATLSLSGGVETLPAQSEAARYEG